MSTIKVIHDSEFEVEVLQATQPVLVYFWADWCGPCRLMAPIAENLATEYGDRLKVVKMAVDPNPVSVKAYKVDGVPAFRVFKSGNLLESLEGAVSKEKIKAMIEPHIG